MWSMWRGSEWSGYLSRDACEEALGNHSGPHQLTPRLTLRALTRACRAGREEVAFVKGAETPAPPFGRLRGFVNARNVRRNRATEVLSQQEGGSTCGHAEQRCYGP